MTTKNARCAEFFGANLQKIKFHSRGIFPPSSAEFLVYIHLAAYDNLVLVNAKVENWLCGCCPGGKSFGQKRAPFFHIISRPLSLRALGCWQNKHFARGGLTKHRGGIEIRPARSAE
jgi:hypothetical protein